MPVDKSNKEVIQLLNSKIDPGIYSLGQLIVPRKFEKILLGNEKIITGEVSILGRKFALTKIREDLLINHKEYMRLTSDQEFSKFTKEEVIEKLLDDGELDESEKLLSLKKLLKKLKQLERTRYFACWHDSSSLNNHSHLLVTINVMYDTACFLTDVNIT